MDMPAILSRIDLRSKDLNLSDAAISQKSGMSPDGIRNWRRRVAAGEASVSANAKNIISVAAVLGVTSEWLLTGEGDMLAADGLAEPGPEMLHPTMTRARGILEKMLEREAAEGTAPSKAIRITIEGERAHIAAVIDREGLAELRRKLDALEELLKD